MNYVKTYNLADWKPSADLNLQETALQHLEQGGLLYFPSLAATLEQDEQSLLTPAYLSPKRKNISWDTHTQILRGCDNTPKEIQQPLSALLERYTKLSSKLMHALFPQYSQHLQTARTSFRPGAISQRVLSPRKDDRLLHVDAFPSTPFGDKRLLRVFSNIHPQGVPRVWRISGPFKTIAQQFLPKLKLPWPGSGYLLQTLGITRGRRHAYDHLMLQLHDAMKQDANYQETAPYQEVSFPPGSTWIVCTDQVAHAAIAGQYMLEQSFYLPVNAMRDPSQAPQRILEGLFNRSLLASH